MTLLSEQILRVRDILQDTDDSTTNGAKIIGSHQEAAQRLARQRAFPQMLWMNATLNQALYTLPNDIVTVSHVLYNEHVLRYTTETALDRRSKGWEDLASSEPRYWTTDNQNRNTLRIVPAPQRTGSILALIPPLPFILDPVDNLIIFHTEDLSLTMNDADDQLPTMLAWDDLLVYHTARLRAEREVPEQNLPVATLCGQLEGMYRQYMRYG